MNNSKLELFKSGNLATNQMVRASVMLILWVVFLIFFPHNWLDGMVKHLTNSVDDFAFFLFNVVHFHSLDKASLKSVLDKAISPNYVYSIVSLKYYILLFTVFVLVCNGKRPVFYNLIYSSMVIYALTVAMLCAKVLLLGELQYGVMMLFSDLRYVVVIIFMVLSIPHNSRLLSAYNRFTEWVNGHFGLGILWIVIPLFLVRGLKNIVEYYLFKTGGFDYLITVEVHLTSALLRMMGYSTHIYENAVFIGPYWVRVIEPCLGIGLMVVFALLIGLIKSHWLNKIVFIVVGEIVIVVLNSLRIALLLLNVRAMNGSQRMTLEVHAYSGHLFYVLVFLLFMVYLFWFHNLNLIKRFR
ncbi:MAG: hypothetical protein ACOYOT_07510 [Bacteroidales bacterium]